MYNNNVSITILSCEKPDIYEKEKFELKRLLSFSHIKWRFIFYSHSMPLISPILNFFNLYKVAKAIVKYNDFDIIHCRSYIPAIIGLKLKKKYEKKYIFDMRGFWPDERVEGGIWNLRNPVYKLVYKYFKKKEKELILNSDYVVTLTNKAKEEIKKWGFYNCPIEVIPCCADPAVFSVESISKRLYDYYKTFIKKENDRSIILSYLGSLETWYLPGEMMHFYKRLLNKYPNSKFVFITKSNPNIIRHYIKKYGVPKNNVIIISAYRNEIPAILAHTDINIFFIKPTYSKIASSPTKHGEVMLMGLPVICNSGIGDVDNIINSSATGYIIKDFTDECFDEAINKLDDFLTISKKHISEQGKKIYSIEEGRLKYLNIYNYLTNIEKGEKSTVDSTT